MRVTFIQTADAFGYKEMLDQTSRTVIEYCRRKSFGYESFVGIKRGVHPWHASFNRILMLHEMVEAGRREWVVYLDADAYVFDLDFDLEAYLAPKSDRSAVLTPIPGKPELWDINNGVMMLNLTHPACRALIGMWRDRFLQVSDEELAALVEWPFEINDQTFLYRLLGAHESIRSTVHYETSGLMNDSHAPFIRQFLRAFLPSQVHRANAVKNCVAEILPEGDDFIDRAYPVIMAALYRGFLKRNPEPSALEHFRPRFDEMGIDAAFQTLVSEFMRSDEFLEKHPDEALSPISHVRAAFRWILGREASPEEIRHHATRLGSGQIDAAALRTEIFDREARAVPA